MGDKVRARRVADKMAAQMRRALEHATPDELGWPGMTPEELIAREWQAWFDEEMRSATPKEPDDGKAPSRD